MAIDLIEVKKKALKALEVIRRQTFVAAAFIFGSHAEGRANEDSDIDMAVFIRGAEHWDLRRRAQIASLVQRESGDQIELHIFSEAAFNNPGPASFAEYIQEHGVKLDIRAKV